MSRARLVITAVVVEHRTQAEVARAYGLTEGWVSKLMARYRAEGEAAFEPQSRRPRTSPNATPPRTVELIVQLRTQLTSQGLDAGSDTIRWHLAHHHHQLEVSRATISRHLKNAGLVEPAPKKRPKTSYRRFAATMPNEIWQADFTYDRVRHDPVDASGTVTLRVVGQLHHIGIGIGIGIGRTHARTHVILLVHDREVRVVNAVTGELLRELSIDPNRDYQPTRRPPGPPRKNPQ